MTFQTPMDCHGGPSAPGASEPEGDRRAQGARRSEDKPEAKRREEKAEGARS